MFICRKCSERLVVPRGFTAAAILLATIAVVLTLFLDQRQHLALAILGLIVLVPLLIYLVTPVRKFR
ncbi:hypothetical protein ACPVPU_11605 [Sphingomonas sp. CJ99]